MSELKAYRNLDVAFNTARQTETVIAEDYEGYCIEFEEDDEVYLKSEADKVFAELKDKLQNVSSLLNQTRECLIESQKLHKRCADNAVKVIRHHKYKRCLDKAKWCAAECVVNQNTYKKFFTRKSRFRIDLFRKWYKRWLKIAEQFKEAK